MSIQRYGFDSFGPGHPGGVIIFDPKGSYVLHADHLAAVAEAEQRVEADNIIIDTINQNNAFDKGYANGVQAARDAVAALHVKFTDSSGVDRCDYCWLDGYGDEALIWPCPTLAAIDALRGESNG